MLSKAMKSQAVKRTGESNRAARVAIQCLTGIMGVAVTIVGGVRGEDLPARSNGPQGAMLAERIAEARREAKLVGMGAIVVVDGEVVATAVDGERKTGSGVLLELDDQWHLGSITKSITATMIARLVEQGKMEWTETVGNAFPDAAIHEDWKPVTLEQLLTHTSGAPANFSFHVMRNHPSLGEECTQERRKAVLDVIASEPVSPPGETFRYSNVGFTIAGAMAEAVTGECWEDLVKREVFDPLGLTSAGFGPPKSPAKTLDQPRGHSQFLAWKVAVGDDQDNTPIIGPAGTVHMSLSDLASYGLEHLQGDSGKGQLLSVETSTRLHTALENRYAYGWVVNAATYRHPYEVIWHNGSNTMWYALVAFIPEKNLVVAVTVNDGDLAKAEPAAWKVVHAMTERFHSEGDDALRKAWPSTEIPKKSPFSAVRWKGKEPEVQVGNEWFRLISLDGIEASEIIEFCHREYDEKWQKRFEEDLVEVLIRMGHLPEDTVQLTVRRIGETGTRTLENVEMTHENRSAIRDAAKAK